MAIADEILALLEAKFREPEYGGCFPIEVKQNNTKLQVFIDSDEGVDLALCQRISRYLEEALDEEGWLGDAYVLEVSSPGVDRPLVLPRQYAKHIGRRLEVRVGDATHTGQLVAVDGTGITLEEKVRRKVGKRKKTELVRREIPFRQIQRTLVKTSF